MIYAFNAKDNVMYSVMKNYFKLSDEEVFETVQSEFDVLKKRLLCKKIPYDKLKGALIPNQNVDMYETCLVIDWSLIDDCCYGNVVFNALLPLLDKDGTYSILCGDYIENFHTEGPSAQQCLRAALNEVLYRCNISQYRHSSQYFLVYFNRLTGRQREKIVEGLLQYSWFTGFADLTHESVFKSYISYILVHAFIKHRKQIIAAHPSDYMDDENVNMSGYPFEDHGFTFVSINEESFMQFLSYKIESILPDEEDISFSFNALFPKFDSLKRLEIVVADKKWNEYLTCKEDKRKGELLETIGYGPDDCEMFKKDIYKKICASYIYNLQKNSYGDLMFNVCVDLPTTSGHLRKTTVALKYHPETGEMSVVTVT